MVMTSDETQIQILANWPMSKLKQIRERREAVDIFKVTVNTFIFSHSLLNEESYRYRNTNFSLLIGGKYVE